MLESHVDSFVLLSFFVFVTMFCLLVFIHPVCMLIACIRNPRHTEKEKGLYFVGMLLTWMFGSVIYAIWASRSRAVRTFTVTSVALLVMSGIHLYGFYENLPAEEKARWQQAYQDQMAMAKQMPVKK